MTRPGGLAKVLIVCLIAAFAAPPAAAQQKPLSPEILKSVVKVTARIPSGARTIPTLGTERVGSGAVIDDNGLVLTIGYVILEADEVTVAVAGGKDVPAEVVAYDHDTGFGLLRAATPLGVAPLELGNSAALEQKQPVLVAGHGGTDNAMGAFVVDRREFAGYWEYLLADAIFTGPPHADFAGAALIDPGGRLVGIGSLFVPNALERDGAALPGNMFVPIDALKPILGDLIAGGRSAAKGRPWLGIYTQDIQGRLFVGRVPDSGPAWSAGIRPGDLVLGVAGVPVEGLADFYRKVWALGEPGVSVPLLVLRGNQPVQLTVKSIDRYDWLKLKPSY